MFKVIIIGGEATKDYNFYKAKCAKILSKKGQEGCGIMIYSTGDKFNDSFAKSHGIDLRYFNADWKADKKNALAVRNGKMLEEADASIIFDDGSKDIANFVKQAIESGKPYRVLRKTT